MKMSFNVDDLIIKTTTIIPRYNYFEVSKRDPKELLKSHLASLLSQLRKRVGAERLNLESFDVSEANIVTLPVLGYFQGKSNKYQQTKLNKGEDEDINQADSAIPEIKDIEHSQAPQFNSYLRLKLVVNAKDVGELRRVKTAILLIADQYARGTNIIASEIDAEGLYTVIKSITPNLKIRGVPGDELSGGGPGALPIKVDAETAQKKAGFDFLDIYKKNNWNNSLKKGEGVTVAILDTWHTRITAQNPASTPVPTNLLYDSLQHKLIDNPVQAQSNLADPNSSEYTLPNYHFPVSDHGTFVAGIIHSIAPQAQIKMYPVLDEWGTGDVFQLMQQMTELIQDIETGHLGNKVVVNMSLMFLRFQPEETEGLTIEELDAIFENLIRTFRQSFENLNQINQDPLKPRVVVVTSVGNAKGTRQHNIGGYTINNIFTLLWVIILMFWNFIQSMLNSKFLSRIVAYFGNPKPMTPEAEYPARYNIDNIIGVSAARFGEKPKKEEERRWLNDFDRNKPEHTTVFSNSPEIFPEIGFITYGGEVEGNTAIIQWPRYSSKKGIIGIYLSDYPDKVSDTGELLYTTNTSGWARWTGTSFAAPIISGSIACALSNDKHIDSLRLNPAKPLLFPVWQNKPLNL